VADNVYYLVETVAYNSTGGEFNRWPILFYLLLLRPVYLLDRYCRLPRT